MRCKERSKCIKDYRKRKCWLKWQLCGGCGVRAHPEEYHKRVISRVAKSGGFCYGKR